MFVELTPHTTGVVRVSYAKNIAIHSQLDKIVPHNTDTQLGAANTQNTKSVPSLGRCFNVAFYPDLVCSQRLDRQMCRINIIAV